MTVSNAGWIGVDLDGTLAHYDGWKGVEHIGEPVPAMVERVKQWLAEGKDVRIFTARVHDAVQQIRVREVIEEWCDTHIGQVLPITNVKDFGMVELWDDRAVSVVTNTGQIMGGPPCPHCKENAVATVSQNDEPFGIGCFRCGRLFYTMPKPEPKNPNCTIDHTGPCNVACCE
jgi:hypothetical protein